MQRTMKEREAADPRGFTLIEVLISMTITIIVMGAVFGLLTRGQQSFRREPQVADLQQSARTALDMVSRDVLQAGGGLPPEFPAFTPKVVDATVGDQGSDPDVLEVIGTPQSAGEMYFEPEVVIAFDGVSIVTVGVAPSSFQVGDLAVFYDDDDLNSDWMMAWVTSVTPDMATQTTNITLEPTYNGISIPFAYSNTDEALTPSANEPCLLTRVSVVRYFTQSPGNDLILMRQVDFGEPLPVAMVDDFQVVYLVGTQPQVKQVDPPHPHPTEGVQITPAGIISGVRITVAARSAEENLAGASKGASGNYIRKTFSSNISPRNILAGCQIRTGGLCSN